MARYSKKEKVSEQTKEESMALAKGIQKPGQTKEQTKLVAQGIQKGIELYKKQHKEKSRELDKKLRKVKETLIQDPSENEPVAAAPTSKYTVLPWALLVLSWLGFAGFLYFTGAVS
mgnify:CR=1 FL=1